MDCTGAVPMQLVHVGCEHYQLVSCFQSGSTHKIVLISDVTCNAKSKGHDECTLAKLAE